MHATRAPPPRPAASIRQPWPGLPRPSVPCRAFWSRKGKADSQAPQSEDASSTLTARPPAQQPAAPSLRPVVVRLPILPGDTVKTLARRHGLTVAKVRAANGGSDKLPKAGGSLPFVVPAVLGPRATRAAADLTTSLVRGVPPPPQPVPWTTSIARSVRDTGKVGVALALAAAGWAFWSGVEGRLANKLSARAADLQEQQDRAAGVDAAVKAAEATASPGREEDDATFDAVLAGAAATAAAEASSDDKHGGAASTSSSSAADAAPPQPAWASASAPKVWRLGVAGDLGAQAVVPLIREEDGGGRPSSAQPAWLCFESPADATAWALWLRDGPVGGGRGGPQPPTTATAALDLSLAALAHGRALAFIPKTSCLAARLEGDPSFANDQDVVLSWLSECADAGLGGVGTLTAADRARLESLAAAAAGAQAAAAQGGDGVVDVEAQALEDAPPSPSSSTRDWWRDPASGLELAWVPVLGLAGGGRGFLMVSAPDPTAIGFAAQEDAAALARAWLASGAAESAGTTVEAVVGLEPSEFAAHLAAGGAGGAVLRPGELRLGVGCSAEELTDALVAAAAGSQG